ncbi:MAG TPA: YicC/YloC family endoribonuclease [Candidatus Acidoferrales bacterium]|nr:YicC/YloC family endoribonuclease [Candidatus Acidoferrales bacterium]
MTARTNSQTAARSAHQAHPRGLRSMTGYAQARAVENGWSLRVSIRSVNHRFLDLHVRVPEGFEPVEPAMRQIVRERVRRGHLDVTLHYELQGAAAVAVNEQVASAYLHTLNSLRAKFSITSEPDLAALLRLPGVIGPPAESLDEEMAKLESVVTGCLVEALDKLDHMREAEALHLRDDMSALLEKISAYAIQIEELAGRARPLFLNRLQSRIRELIGEAQLDPARLAQEAAIAVERSDISEELTRLRSHVRQFESLLVSGADVGKKLDFLLQEMQRETNTLLSKTPGNEGEALEITRRGLEIKSEIEKLREQVQNIE